MSLHLYSKGYAESQLSESAGTGCGVTVTASQAGRRAGTSGSDYCTVDSLCRSWLTLFTPYHSLTHTHSVDQAPLTGLRDTSSLNLCFVALGIQGLSASCRRKLTPCHSKQGVNNERRLTIPGYRIAMSIQRFWFFDFNKTFTSRLLLNPVSFLNPHSVSFPKFNSKNLIRGNVRTFYFFSIVTTNNLAISVFFSMVTTSYPFGFPENSLIFVSSITAWLLLIWFPW